MKESHTVTVALVPGVCGNCKHWRMQDLDRSGHRLCELTATAGDTTDEQRAAMPAYVEDYDGMEASLWTLPTFGCSQWEVKE